MSSDSESISRVWDTCHRIFAATSYARSMDVEPLVSVVRGKPTDLETAALVTVLVAASSAVDAQPPPRKISAWARSARPSIGPRSWKASTQPR